MSDNMESVSFTLVIAACGCLFFILWRHKVRWHSDIILTDKGKEKLDKLDLKFGIAGLAFLALAFVCFLINIYL